MKETIKTFLSNCLYPLLVGLALLAIAAAIAVWLFQKYGLGA